MRICIWACKSSWNSARKLAESLRNKINKKVILVGSNNNKFKPRQKDVFINYGNSSYPIWKNENLFLPFISQNKMVSHKRRFFTEAPSKIRHLLIDYTENPATAKTWDTVIARTLLNSSKGKGIIVWSKKNIGIELPEAPLYTKYKKKRYEYRVHVYAGKVIDTQIKRKRKGVGINSQIRNLQNGWVFCRENIFVPADLHSTALAVIDAYNLFFGAVDIIYNQKENKCYVLEINTAPGLEGTTLTKYTKAIIDSLFNSSI